VRDTRRLSEGRRDCAARVSFNVRDSSMVAGDADRRVSSRACPPNAIHVASVKRGACGDGCFIDAVEGRRASPGKCHVRRVAAGFAMLDANKSFRSAADRIP